MCGYAIWWSAVKFFSHSQVPSSFCQESYIGFSDSCQILFRETTCGLKVVLLFPYTCEYFPLKIEQLPLPLSHPCGVTHVCIKGKVVTRPFYSVPYMLGAWSDCHSYTCKCSRKVHFLSACSVPDPVPGTWERVVNTVDVSPALMELMLPLLPAGSLSSVALPSYQGNSTFRGVKKF